MTPVRLRLREILKQVGMTQKELAAKAGVREATISRIARGETTRIELDTLDRLARALGVDVTDLIERQPKRGKK